MAKLLGRKARNRLWSGLGDGKSTKQYKKTERSREKKGWRRDHGLQ